MKPKLRIGVDFGTTYSKIGWIDEQNRLQLFTYPGRAANARADVPTAVAYSPIGRGQTLISVGNTARENVLNKTGIEFCENFKMLLPLETREQWVKEGWASDRTPAQVTADYLRQLLVDSKQSFISEFGDIESLVVSVPEVWQQGQNRGAEILQRIVRDELHLPLDHLRSEPVCAAAFYAWLYERAEGQGQRRTPLEGYLLVCDVGGGTFDVAYCHVKGRQIRILDFGGSGDTGIGLAGVAFDRNAVLRAYAARARQQPDIHSVQFVRTLRDFEVHKINQHDTVEALLDMVSPAEVLEMVLYEWRDGYKLKKLEVDAAFAPIREGIQSVLSRIPGAGAKVDRLAIVGSFGRFRWVREAILEALGISAQGDVRYEAQLTGAHAAFAVCFGATLIANHMFEIMEKYPHTVGVRAHFYQDGYLKEDFLPVISAGHELVGGGEPVFMRRPDGSLIDVEVSGEAVGPLAVYVKYHGTEALSRLPVTRANFPPPGKYNLGLCVNSSNLGRLIFRSTTGGQEYVYDLSGNKIELLVR